METESPEQLDNLLDLRKMPIWMGKVAILVLLVMGLIYGIFASKKDMAPGQGIFARDLNNVPTLTEGTLQDIYVAEGDFVRAGQVVARISQGKTDQELEALRSKVQLKLDSHNMRAAKERQVRERVLNSTFKRISNLEVMQVIAERNYQNSVDLAARNLITKLELQDLRGKEADIRRQMADAEAERAKNMSVYLIRRPLSGPAESTETHFDELPAIAQQLVLTSRSVRKQILDSAWMGESLETVAQRAADERRWREQEEELTGQIRTGLRTDFSNLSTTEASATTKALQAKREQVRAELIKIDSVKYTDKALERVVEILDLESKLTLQEIEQLRYGLIRSLTSGRVVEVRYEVGEILPSGSNILGLEQQGQGLRVTAFMNAKQAKHVKIGMPVQISPSTVKREEFGFLRGRVDSIAAFPASPERMELVLRNKMVVEQINKDGSMLEATIALEQKPNGRFFWAFGDGPPQDPTSGTVCQVNVQTGESAPITKLLPFLRRFLHRPTTILEPPPRKPSTENSELIPALENGEEGVTIVPGQGTARPGENLEKIEPAVPDPNFGKPQSGGETTPSSTTPPGTTPAPTTGGEGTEGDVPMQDMGPGTGGGRIEGGPFTPVEKPETGSDTTTTRPPGSRPPPGGGTGTGRVGDGRFTPVEKPDAETETSATPP